MRSTHKRGVTQDDLRLVGEDVELDDVAVAVPVDDLGVCEGKRSRGVRTQELTKANVSESKSQRGKRSVPRAAKVPLQNLLSLPECSLSSALHNFDAELFIFAGFPRRANTKGRSLF